MDCWVRDPVTVYENSESDRGYETQQLSYARAETKQAYPDLTEDLGHKGRPHHGHILHFEAMQAYRNALKVGQVQAPGQGSHTRRPSWPGEWISSEAAQNEDILRVWYDILLEA